MRLKYRIPKSLFISFLASYLFQNRYLWKLNVHKPLFLQGLVEVKRPQIFSADKTSDLWKLNVHKTVLPC